MSEPFRSVQDVWDDLADCDKRERQMELYGPYDPRADEVMEGWRPATFAAVVHTPAERIAEAAVLRRMAALMPENEHTLKLARALELGNGEGQ